MTIGPYTVRAFDAGLFALDGGAMFGVVPRPLWEKQYVPDARNRIAMSTRCLLITGAGKNILVDTGNGAKLGSKLEEIYGIVHEDNPFAVRLAPYGLRPEDITDVILTHLHFDHAGGATTKTNYGIVPTFPNARYYVQRDHWNAALNPTERDRASFFPENYKPLMEYGVLELIDGEGELFPGIRVQLFHGHTSALQSPVISDGTTTLFFCADLIPMAAHVNLPWIMGYDLRPLVTLEEKRVVLDRAADEQWLLCLEHDPSVEALTVERGPKGIATSSARKLL
jgi:glyoxylase-like metal-dependent hydrolase (beta-lactamase superfamily II)